MSLPFPRNGGPWLGDQPPCFYERMPGARPPRFDLQAASLAAQAPLTEVLAVVG